MKYVCDMCGWVFDEEEQGKKWEEVGEDFECPLCGVGKDNFSQEKSQQKRGGRYVPPLFVFTTLHHFIRKDDTYENKPADCSDHCGGGIDLDPLCLYGVFAAYPRFSDADPCPAQL